MSVRAVTPASLVRDQLGILIVQTTEIGPVAPTFQIGGEDLTMRRLTAPGTAVQLFEVVVLDEHACGDGAWSVVLAGEVLGEGILGLVEAPTEPAAVISAWDDRVAEQVTCGTAAGNGVIGSALDRLDAGEDASGLARSVRSDLAVLATNLRRSLRRQRDLAEAVVASVGGSRADQRRIRNAGRGGRAMVRRIARGFSAAFEKAAGLDC